jgi:hypothetical protein
MPQVLRSSCRSALFVIASLLAACSALGSAPTTRPSLVAPNQLVGSQMRAKGVVGSLYISSQLKHAVAVYGGAPLEYSGSIRKGLSEPAGIAFNSKKELFVADYGLNDIKVYAASTGKLIRTLSTRYTKNPYRLAVAPNDDVYVISRTFVNIFIAGQQSNSKKIKLKATDVSFDGSGNAYIATAAGSIDVFPPSKTKLVRTITEGIDRPLETAVDGNGNLYVSNSPSSGCGNVTVYNAATGALESTITTNVCGPRAIAFDSQNNAYIGNSTPMTINVFSVGTYKWLTAITNGLNDSGSMVFDPSGNLYVANVSYPGNVVVYSPGSTKPSQTLTHGISFPSDLAWLP